MIGRSLVHSATIFVLALACLQSLAVAAQSYSTFQTGNSYRRLPSGAQNMYLQGQVDGFVMGALMSHNQKLAESIMTCTAQMESGQLVAIVNNYVATNPGQWNLNVNALVFTALAMACESQGTTMAPVVS